VTFLTDSAAWDLHWQMSPAERATLQVLVRRRRPDLAIEVGTYQGGSLQVLSEYSGKVVSLDIDPTVPERLGGRFSNVEYRIGDSKSILPGLVRELNACDRPVGLVLIDGDHSAEGVRGDINAILELQVRQRLVILLHDSFNPDCRHGMRTAAWAANPHVQFVELDFTVGSFHAHGMETAAERSMWGGFACAVLEPTLRTTDLEIRERQRSLFDIVYRRSVHCTGPGRTPLDRFLRRLWRSTKRLVLGGQSPRPCPR
jgi:hypothetical protein